MKSKTLVKYGSIGLIVSVTGIYTPILSSVLGAIGLSSVMELVAFLLMPLFMISISMIVFSFIME